MTDALREVRKAGGRQFVFALSSLAPSLAVKVAGMQDARGVGIAQTFPNPNGVALPLQRAFKAAMSAYDAKLTQFTSFHVEGYVSAMVLAEGLKRAGHKPDAANLSRALRQMSEFDTGGFRVNFSQGNEGSRFVDIAVLTSSGQLLS